MKIHEIKELKTEEIVQRIKDEERNLVDLRFSHQLKQLTNTSKLKNVKRDIAKLKTVLRERESQLVSTEVKGAKA
ncbi:MAG: 50S ribosomal protein L29 [Ignavibacteriota bacterium]|jgi:large subunit ribosomal protein L29|nr:MAG: 50S ribosomal protein L29 [Chlorobiota bacterium]MBE7476954.1 50S ribosomal protein L29 [Ignavibacteriales bacterium]MBL1121796.1 50S ribosomal protein L29 [Ignavibacteriota bacterium]MBV6419859.1 50S ribosomal protein L29 [Ignavibacteriaceae bacterium]MCE7855314.1 50S ribosomal protein L29 [Ignavibacteria bacterium CHB3]MEB2295609.1 50S ribosomal protein L29 [Ignavibacteria bacterium]